MNYIYDILLNFNRQLYDFFEWDLNDHIIHIRKIPIFRVNSKSLLSFRDCKVKLDKAILEKIKNRTEVFTHKDLETVLYSALFTDGSSVLGLQFNKDGYSTSKSYLLIDEDIEVLDVANRLREQEIHFSVISKENDFSLKTRKQQRMEKFIKEELKKSEKQHEYEKLEYLYFECVGKNNTSIETILSYFYKQIKQGNDIIVNKLYNFLKLTYASK